MPNLFVKNRVKHIFISSACVLAVPSTLAFTAQAKTETPIETSFSSLPKPSSKVTLVRVSAYQKKGEKHEKDETVESSSASTMKYRRDQKEKGRSSVHAENSKTIKSTLLNVSAKKTEKGEAASPQIKEVNSTDKPSSPHSKTEANPENKTIRTEQKADESCDFAEVTWKRKDASLVIPVRICGQTTMGELMKRVETVLDSGSKTSK